ncbi:MAG: kinase [Chloroflexi bacterium]|nr:kinase [Chloroflexota bacterium]
MIISRTPFRISFFGGGTDYPAWYRRHGGAVLATSIDKYCYITCRYLPPFFEHKIRIVYSRIENCHSLEEVAHPSVREVLRFLSIDRGVEIHHDGDLPARSGMGTSSSFTVGLLHALHALEGRMPGKKQLATEAIQVEQEGIGETVGSQDQVSAAYGGLNHIVFHPNGDISVQPITISKDRLEELNSHLMLFYTGLKRTASEIADSYVGNVDEKKRELRVMKDLVDESISILVGGQEITDFGELLHESWQAKRSLSSQVSNADVDQIYEEATSAGAVGGKLIGAGGGGFMLLFVPPSHQTRVRERLNGLLHVPFRFEHSGSQIIFFDLEQDYADQETDRANQPIRKFRELVLNRKKEAVNS